MKTLTKLAAALVCSTAIAGCATSPSVPDYTATGEDTARLRIALNKGAVPPTAAGDGMNVFLHTTSDCTAPQVLGAVYTLDQNAEQDEKRRSRGKAGELDMPLGEYDRLEVDELLIDAGKDKSMAVQFAVLLGGPFGAFTRCNIALEQTFEAGKDYEIQGRFDTTTSCSAVVNELVEGSDGWTRKEINRVNSRRNPLSQACFVQY